MRALLWAVAFVAGCKTGGMGTSSSGSAEDRYEFALVGPLEDGLLLTGVTVNTAGPYVFLIDPDANTSVVDAQVVKDGKIRATEGPARLDESNTPQPRIYADLVNVEIGSLVIERHSAIVVKSGTYDSGGRRIYGVIGRDMFPEGAVLGFKRDRGVVVVIPTEQYKPAAGAIAIPYETLAMKVPGEGLPVPRRVVKATVNGAGPFTMHLDLGTVPSQLREAAWESAKLVMKELEGALVDEIGTIRKLDKISEPTHAELGAIASDKVVFVPYGEKRWADHEIDGTLGLGFFAPYDMWLNADKKTLYLEKRVEATYQMRMGRWDFGPIAKCEHAGCVTVRIVDPLAGKELEEGKPHPGVVLSLTRDERAGGTDLEVVLDPNKPELPRLIVNMPPNADRVIDHLGPEWIGVTFNVIDASPFPRKCQNPGPCVDRFAR